MTKKTGLSVRACATADNWCGAKPKCARTLELGRHDRSRRPDIILAGKSGVLSIKLASSQVSSEARLRPSWQLRLGVRTLLQNSIKDVARPGSFEPLSALRSPLKLVHKHKVPLICWVDIKVRQGIRSNVYVEVVGNYVGPVVVHTDLFIHPGQDGGSRQRNQGSVANPPPRAQANTKKSQASPRRITMCMKVECPTCHKATWKGCGQHIDAALTGASVGHHPRPKRYF